MVIINNIRKFATAKRENIFRNVAQLVAHYVRDVGVGRSSRLIPTNYKISPDGGIGRRAGLKHQWSNIHPGSTPGLGTKRVKYLKIKYLTRFLLYTPLISPNFPSPKEDLRYKY